MTAPRARLLTFIWLALAFLSLTALGGLQRQQAFLTRGLPPALPEPLPHTGVIPGLNVYLEQYDEAELQATLSEIRTMGIRYVKQSFYFSPDFDWQAADRVVTAVAEHDLILVPLLDGDPQTDFAPPDLAAFARWTATFAERYAETVQYYIIWDEPNLTSHWGGLAVNPSEYGALLSAAAQAIRAADSNAVIIAAPLAPTIETGPENLADPLFLQALYEEGANHAFDIVMAKPYGFNASPVVRTVDLETTNFNRAILLRDVLEKNGEGDKAIWLGNWGWNALPAGWSGEPSVWGLVSEHDQAHFTVDGLKRAQQEWPWLGVMFLENWEPAVPENDPHWGFSIAGRETAAELAHFAAHQDPAVAWPGFHPAVPDDPAQVYEGGWEFSPEFGADISRQPDEQLLGDKVTFTFWGTEAGLRVRRANFRARLYITIDGEPANALPQDEHGAMLVLTAADPAADYLTTELVATGLTPRQHTMEVVASRGWDQWALNGFSVAYRPALTTINRLSWLTVTACLIFMGLAVYTGRQADWRQWFQDLRARYSKLDTLWQIMLTWTTAVIVTIGGWLTWSEQAAGLYRRLGDGSQLAITAVAASIFYISPSFILMIGALIILFVLIYWRPAWGVALVAICFPFYVSPVLKPVFAYRFSPVEIFTLTTFAAFMLRQTVNFFLRKRGTLTAVRPFRLSAADGAVGLFFLLATLSLLFTERLDVATNEWRMVILEPVLFYIVLRGSRPSQKEMWTILDAFVLGGLLVALYGLWQYGFDRDSLITAEGGILRLKSIYGSPNNVGLYLGRILPLLAAMLLVGTTENGRRRWLYGLSLLPLGLTILLTFSKGAIFLGLPAAFLFIFWRWQRLNGRRTWPWLILFGAVGVGSLFLIQQSPALAGRLGLFGETGLFRLNLWQAGLNMIRANPWFGVGLDNFLYAYRGRYIFDAAWRDPNLSHPHNLLLDFASRLGLLGFLAGSWLLAMLPVSLYRCRSRIPRAWLPIWVGLGAGFIDMISHGLVDHSFFLVDLAFAYFLILGTAVWLNQYPFPTNPETERVNR